MRARFLLRVFEYSRGFKYRGKERNRKGDLEI